MYWFCLSKVFEFVDTIFLRLRKRPVILLHWYHHICTMAYCWHGTYGIEHGADASGWFFAAMNLVRRRHAAGACCARLGAR